MSPENHDLFPKESKRDVPQTRSAQAHPNLLSNFEECQKAVDTLFRNAYQTEGNAAFLRYLDFVRRISNLSVYNAMLVGVQRPGATAVATARKWADQFHRDVRPDAIPIVILRPFGPVEFVYDLDDTVGPPIAGAKESSLYASGSLDLSTYERVLRAAETYGIQVTETTQYGALLAGTAAGIAIIPEALEAGFRIKLNARHELQTRFSTLAHELGHVFCGHVGGDPKGRWPCRMHLTNAQSELEAEAVAWLVCQRHGIVSRSAEYLRSLVSPEALAGISLYAIFDAANRVEARTSPARKRPSQA
jgi:hypothetical protein